MSMKEQKQTDPMEQAYKQLDGEPAGDAVSQAAKGEQPESAYEENEDHDEDQVERFKGGTQDLDDAYAALFEAIATIIKNK